MLAYERSAKDLKSMVSQGIEAGKAGSYTVEDLEGYLEREYYENRREQGYEVPEIWQTKSASIKERELKYREMLLARTEKARTNAPILTAPSRYEVINDDEDLVYDWHAEEWIPEWMYTKRAKVYKLEELQRKHNDGKDEVLKEMYMNKLRNAILREKHSKR